MSDTVTSTDTTNSNRKSESNPWIYVPTLYFAQGLPYTIVMMMSTVYFKDLGASNTFIGLAGLLNYPWTLKFAWAPLVDFLGKKKIWIVSAEIALFGTIALFAGTALTAHPLELGVGVLAVTALASATHDAAIDGYYLEVLNKDQQALFVGVRNTAFRLAMIFGTGTMVILAGHLSHQMGKAYAWMTSFAILALIFLCLFAVHCWYLPLTTRQVESKEIIEPPAQAEQQLDAEAGSLSANKNDYFRAIFSYFDQPGWVAIVLYILLFRLGDALVMRMIPPFLQDPISKNGMGLTVEQIGTIYGTVGVCFLLLGGIAGGFLVSKQGLKRWFWPATLVMNSTILLYWLLATFRPSSISWVYIVNSIEQFGYGFGMAAYTVFLLSTVKPEFKAAHYAMATAMMAVGLMGPNTVSGMLCDSIGYANFFLLSFFLTIPGMITIPFLPVWQKQETTGPAAS